jgi:signal transduction histidine kinase/DNA-binding LacI/PurR family transcriptional regulator
METWRSKSQSAASRDHRPTIAFLTRSFSMDLIGFSLWSGVFQEARARGVNVVCLPGNPPRSRLGFEFQANALYDMVDRNTMDGLVIWGGAMIAGSSYEDTLVFFRRFSDFPIINISFVLEGVPSLIIDNYGGMRQACEHLIARHQCRRLAFIQGPALHPESQERFRAYQEALAAANIAYDPELVVTGNFLRETGRQSIRCLLDERRVAFDAVVAANDIMALGAAEELIQRGIRIPDEVKVTGFDNIDESRHFQIPLTTVQQPFAEMGKTAVQNLLSLIRGEPFTENLVLPSRLVTRQSCGCAHTAVTHDAVGPAHSQAPAPLPARTRMQELLAGSPCADLAGSPDRIVLLTDALYDDITTGTKDAFLAELDRILLGEHHIESLTLFQDFLSAFRGVWLPFLSPSPVKLIATETIFHRARLMIADYIDKTRTATAFQMAAFEETMRTINRIMISTYNFEDFLTIIAREFPHFNLPGYYFCIYDKPSVSLEYSRLLLAFSGQDRIPLPPDGVCFPTTLIVPEGMLPAGRQYAIIVEPLYFRGEHLGYFVFEDDHKFGALYEELRLHVSVALNGTLLFQEKERLLSERERQTQHLLSTSNGLARSNAELEKFTYIVSHDLKEPLRKIAVFAERLQAHLTGIDDRQATDYIERMLNASMRMHQLIDDLLSYSRLASNAEPFRKVDLNESVRTVLQDLEVRIEQARARIAVERLPVIEGEPRHLEQLLQNLISNALKFRLPDRPVEISIKSAPKKDSGRDYCVLTVSDNGIGIDEKHFVDIFEAFQRLHGQKEYEGTGIGLAICKKVVEEHHGQIAVESIEGEGSHFIITLPLHQ